MSSMTKFIVLKTEAKKYTYDILLPSKILYCTSSGQFTNPCGQGRGVVNGNEVKQLSRSHDNDNVTNVHRHHVHTTDINNTSYKIFKRSTKLLYAISDAAIF